MMLLFFKLALEFIVFMLVLRNLVFMPRARKKLREMSDMYISSRGKWSSIAEQVDHTLKLQNYTMFAEANAEILSTTFALFMVGGVSLLLSLLGK